jgi:hypothetical protein
LVNFFSCSAVPRFWLVLHLQLESLARFLAVNWEAKFLSVS